LLQAGLTAAHSAIVNNISQEMNGRYLSLQKQHQEFAAHLNNQIASLEQQLNQMMQGLYLVVLFEAISVHIISLSLTALVL